MYLSVPPVFRTVAILLASLVLLACARTSTPTPALAADAYLFASFRGNGEGGLHLAYSRDGLNWTALNGDNPVLTPKVGTRLMRDPTLIRGPEGFHMVWTSGWEDQGIGIAHSDDLMHWSDQTFLPVMENFPSAKNAWAPELFYDQQQQNFVIFWASTLPGTYPDTEAKADKGWDHRIYATRTEDFNTYSPTSLFYQPGFNVIDATISSSGSSYVMLVKDETRYPAAKRLHAAFSESSDGPWQRREQAFSPDDLWVEGPTVLPVDDGYMVYFDAYITHHFGAMFTRDFIHWEEKTPALNLPAGTRHGSVLAISEPELSALIAEYGDDTAMWTRQQLEQVCSGTPLTCQLSEQPGNYQVAISFTDKIASVYAESRRLMYSREVNNDSDSPLYLAINVREAEGQPIQEVDEPDKPGLNLTLTDSLEGITNVRVTRVPRPRSVFIIGDSTVADQTRQWQKPANHRYSGWGQMLPAWFSPTITVVNYADSGEGTEAFSVPDGVLWQPIAMEIQPDDWVLVQLGHNDKKTPRDTYVERMRSLLSTIKGKGAHPVLISPMIRNHGIPLGKQHIYGDLVLRVALPEIAAELDVPYIDLMSLTHDWAASAGQKQAQTFFVENDRTHSNPRGAMTFAGFIVEEMQRQQLPLTHYLRAGASDNTGQPQ